MARQVSGRRGGDFGQWLSFHSAGWSPLIFHLFWCAFLTFCFYSYFVVPFLYFLTTVRGGARWCFIFFMCLFYIFYQSADDISSFYFCFYVPFHILLFFTVPMIFPNNFSSFQFNLYVPFLHFFVHSAGDVSSFLFSFFMCLFFIVLTTVPMIFTKKFSPFLFFNHISLIFQWQPFFTFFTTVPMIFCNTFSSF